jgi:hypothetical protein
VAKKTSIQRNIRSLYKGRFFLVFYDKSDENLKYMFDNVRDILKFMGQEVTRLNVNRVNVELYRALSSKEHFCRFLTGEVLRVYMISNDDVD